ncbi:lipopolysaccharide biosynthesis protein [Ruania halotolerans]|uniref:lipopolysaccharide biosynthesis protein n=1 Tax=Ruania halotolerans TaxID=2897773 RepID=UPI001E472C76|nr:polysaccharide biosynthesis C-terminal domain-containing protein [Ruania halotolerans]UFU07264.1 polysaccharide biosynthesis C-terminal domain-containing protein [Ruania halotolerans]
MIARRSRRRDAPGQAAAPAHEPEPASDRVSNIDPLPAHLTETDSGSPRAIARVTLSRYFAMALSVLVGVVLARSMVPEDRGVYAVALTLTAVPAIVVSAGLETAALRTANRDQRAEVFGLIMRRIVVITGLIVVLVTTVLLARIGILGLSTPQLAICLISIPPVVAVQLYGNAILGLRRWWVWVAGTLMNAAIYLLATMVIAAVGQAGVAAYQVAFLAGYLVALLCFVWVVRRHPHDLRTDRTSAVAHTASRTRSITISQALFMRMQVPLLQALSGTAAVGILAVASPVADLLLVLPVAAGTVLLPRYYSSETSPTAVRHNALRIAALAAAVGAVAALAAPWLVPLLYGTNYSGAARVLQIMVPGVVLFSYARVVQSYLISRSRYRLVLWASLLAVVVSVGVQLAATPSLGAIGGALAISAGYTTMFVVICSARLRDRVAE